MPAPSVPTVAQVAVIDAPATATGTVIGGPGTGKTYALVERVAALIAGGLVPEQVLALTPNRQAATALRDRIGVRVRVATPGPLARSLGSFAFQLVRGTMVHSGQEPPALLTGADQDRIIADLLAGDAEDEAEPGGARRWPEELGATVRSSRAFRSELRAFLTECTELGVTSAELARSERPAWRAVGSFAEAYRGVLDRARAAHRDAADLLAEAAAILRTADTTLLGPAGRTARRAHRRRAGAHRRRGRPGLGAACAGGHGDGVRRSGHLLGRLPRRGTRALRPPGRRCSATCTCSIARTGRIRRSPP